MSNGIVSAHIKRDVPWGAPDNDALNYNRNMGCYSELSETAFEKHLRRLTEQRDMGICFIELIKQCRFL